MQRIFRRYLYVIMIIACTALLGVNYFLSGMNIRTQKSTAFDTKLGQITQTFQNNDLELSELEKAIDEDYLTRAQSFAYIIQQNAHVLANQEELKKIARLLCVDELHVTDGNGIIRYSTVSKYIGFDFHDGEQTGEFLSLLDDTTGTEYLNQKEQPNSTEGKTMKYVGISRGSPPGIIQIGVEPKRLLAAKARNTCSYIFSQIPTEPGEEFIAFNESDGTVVGSTYKKAMNGDYTLNQKQLQNICSQTSGKIYMWDHDAYYTVTTQYNDIRICAVIRTDILYQNRLFDTIVTSVYMLFLGVILTISLDILIDRKVVHGIQRILLGLSEIKRGNLNTRISVKDSPELTELSSGINSMVDSILDSNTHMSKILDMTGISLASFKCEKDSEKVTYTALLSNLLGLSDADTAALLNNRARFMKYLQDLQKTPVPDEKDIYQITQNGQYKYLKICIVSDSSSQLGIIMDVTEDITKKQLMRYEHDHDHLTGLPIYQYFEKTVEQILSDPFARGCAAGIMMDLDKFKSINDTYGHDFGDNYLKHMAQKMRELPSDHCFPARRSGDEFCLFLYGYSSQEELLSQMHAFWESIKDSPIRLPDQTLRELVVSGGLAWANDNINMAKLMYCADVALYTAKKQFPGTLQIFDENSF